MNPKQSIPELFLSFSAITEKKMENHLRMRKSLTSSAEFVGVLQDRRLPGSSLSLGLLIPSADALLAPFAYAVRSPYEMVLLEGASRSFPNVCVNDVFFFFN